MSLSIARGLRSGAAPQAGKARQPQVSRSRMDHVLAGLGAAAVFFAGPARLPAIERDDGIAADWRAVGGDLAAAMKRRER